MNFESATGLANDELQAFAEQLMGTQDKLHTLEGLPEDIDFDLLADDLYDGQFAAICSYCGFWVDPILLDADDICEACVNEIEEEEQDDLDDDYCRDDDPADDGGLDYGFHVVDEDYDDPDFDDEDEVWEEEWDDADLDGIDDDEWDDEDD